MCIDTLEESRRAVTVLRSDLSPRNLNQGSDKAPAWPDLLDLPVQAGPGMHWFWRRPKTVLTRRFRPGVTLIVQDDMARVLDIHRGQFFALDLIGTRMLFSTLKAGAEAMVRELAAEYWAAEAQVRQDWTALVEEMHQAGLTETVCQRAAARILPGRWGVWLRLTLAWASFGLLGWERTLRAWRHCTASAASTEPDEVESVLAEVDRLVRRSAGRHLLNPRCKERALTAWHILRRLSIPARLVMGVSLYPFEGHAWTEV